MRKTIAARARRPPRRSPRSTPDSSCRSTRTTCLAAAPVAAAIFPRSPASQKQQASFPSDRCRRSAPLLNLRSGRQWQSASTMVLREGPTQKKGPATGISIIRPLLPVRSWRRNPLPRFPARTGLDLSWNPAALGCAPSAYPLVDSFARSRIRTHRLLTSSASRSVMNCSISLPKRRSRIQLIMTRSFLARRGSFIR
jgi:hypothetical protein